MFCFSIRFDFEVKHEHNRKCNFEYTSAFYYEFFPLQVELDVCASVWKPVEEFEFTLKQLEDAFLRPRHYIPVPSPARNDNSGDGSIIDDYFTKIQQ